MASHDDDDGKAGEPPSDGDYDVGYGKPPAATRFKPGNKLGKGRPKGSKNLKTIVMEAFGAKAAAKVNGKVVKLPKIELALHQLANKASAGDLQAIGKAVELHERYGPQEDPAGPSPEEIAADLDSLEQYLALRQQFGDDEEDQAA